MPRYEYYANLPLPSLSGLPVLANSPVPLVPFPEIKCYEDVWIHRRQLLDAIKSHPIEDPIYCLKGTRCHTKVDLCLGIDRKLPDAFMDAPMNWCIAGSAAVEFFAWDLAKFGNLASEVYILFARKVLNMAGKIDKVRDQDKMPELNQAMTSLATAFKLVKEHQANCKIIDSDYLQLHDRSIKVLEIASKLDPAFLPLLDEAQMIKKDVPVDHRIHYGNGSSKTSGDIDLFMLNSACVHRMKIRDLDIVHVTEKTPEELLTNFDLGCCRAAFNSRGDIWISAQCLSALVSGTYYLPAYLATYPVFLEALKKARPGENFEKGYTEYLYGRTCGRIEKYVQRGVRPTLVETDQIPLWMQQRFFYGTQ